MKSQASFSSEVWSPSSSENSLNTRHTFTVSSVLAFGVSKLQPWAQYAFAATILTKVFLHEVRDPESGSQLLRSVLSAEKRAAAVAQ